MAHGDHLKYQAKPKAGRQTLFRLTSYLVCDRLYVAALGKVKGLCFHFDCLL